METTGAGNTPAEQAVPAQPTGQEQPAQQAQQAGQPQPAEQAQPAQQAEQPQQAAQPAKRKGKWKGIAAASGAVLVGALVLGGAVAVQNNRPDAEVGTGYAAQAACLARFHQHSHAPRRDLPEHPLTDLISVSYDEFGQSTTGSIYSLYDKTSYYQDGVGCVVVPAGADRPTFDNPPPATFDRLAMLNKALPFAPGHEAPEVSVNSGDGIVFAEGQLGSVAAQARVQRAVDAAMEAPGARGVAVITDRTLTHQAYAPGFSAATPQLGWSMTKSVTNMLAGRVIMEDPSFDLQAPVMFRGQPQEYSVNDLLRMQSGLQWDETYDTTGDVTQMLYRSPDMAAYVMSKAQEHPAGTYREYSTGSTVAACRAMQDSAVGQPLGTSFAWELLFRPLGMATATLSPDPSGTLACGSYLHAAPIDWAKLGQLMLDDGVLATAAGPQRLLPEGWVAESLQETAVATIQANADGSAPPAYGSGWWLNAHADGTLQYPDLPADLYWADGHDGQFMVIVPSAQLIVVRQGFSPGVSVEDSGTLDIVRAVLAGVEPKTD